MRRRALRRRAVRGRAVRRGRLREGAPRGRASYGVRGGGPCRVSGAPWKATMQRRRVRGGVRPAGYVERTRTAPDRTPRGCAAVTARRPARSSAGSVGPGGVAPPAQSVTTVAYGPTSRRWSPGIRPSVVMRWRTSPVASSKSMSTSVPPPTPVSARTGLSSGSWRKWAGIGRFDVALVPDAVGGVDRDGVGAERVDPVPLDLRPGPPLRLEAQARDPCGGSRHGAGADGADGLRRGEVDDGSPLGFAEQHRYPSCPASSAPVRRSASAADSNPSRSPALCRAAASGTTIRSPDTATGPATGTRTLRRSRVSTS